MLAAALTQMHLAVLTFLGLVGVVALSNLLGWKRLGEYGPNPPAPPSAALRVQAFPNREGGAFGASASSRSGVSSAATKVSDSVALLRRHPLLVREGWGEGERPRPSARDLPNAPVSILVPARNEAENIGACVRALLAQDYPHYEVIALDDHSTDDTGDQLRVLAASDARLQVLAGQALPPGWLGKHWACHQLARAASGDRLLFVDADTRLAPGALSAAIAALQAERAGLVTVLPRQAMSTWGERLLVPILPWSLFCFLPVALAHRWQWPGLSASVGQFMLFTRAAYERAGGHAAVRATPVDDIALGRRVMEHGDGWRLLDGGDLVRCRMYRGLRQAVAGFGRTLFAAFNDRALPFTLIWLWLAVVFTLPPLTLAAGALGLLPAGFDLRLPLAAVGASLLLWALCAWRFALPPMVVALYPVSVLLMTFTALRSLVITRAGRATWRGRALAGR